MTDADAPIIRHLRQAREHLAPVGAHAEHHHELTAAHLAGAQRPAGTPPPPTPAQEAS